MNITWIGKCPTGVPVDGQAIRELTAAVQELTLVVRGLTGVLIEDRDVDITDQEAEPASAPAPTYMDGTPVGE